MLTESTLNSLDANAGSPLHVTMKTDAKTTALERYRRAFARATRLLREIDALMSQHSDEHEAAEMTEAAVGDIEVVVAALATTAKCLRQGVSSL